MEILKELSNNIQNNKLEVEQNNFLDSILGKTINVALDIGLRAILPDLIENQIIDIKNTLLSEGLSEGINTTINSAINLGKSAIGIITGNFENISQVQNAVEKGGLIDTFSNTIDFILNKTTNNGIIDKNTSNLIKQGKNVLLNNVSKNIESTLTEQIKGMEKLNNYSNNWNKFYNERDFENMEKEFNKIKKQLNELVPLENTIKEARKIENIHTLIKNNNGDFNLTKNEIELANKLV